MNRIFLFTLGVILLASPIVSALEIEGFTIVPHQTPPPLIDTQFKTKVLSLKATQSFTSDWNVIIQLECYDLSHREAAIFSASRHSDDPFKPEYYFWMGASKSFSDAQWRALVADTKALKAFKTELFDLAITNLAKTCEANGYKLVLKLVD